MQEGIVSPMFPYVRITAAATAILVGLTLAMAQEPKSAGPTHGKQVHVQLTTTAGPIILALDAQRAPETVQNFLAYVQQKHYQGTVFHRVIDGFMIQGGGLDSQLSEKPTRPPVKNESNNGLKNAKYTVAMARLGNDPHSATSQFFINLADNSFLNRDESDDGFGYAVFGKVVQGEDVVNSIAQAPTQTQPNPAFPAQLLQDIPVNPVVVTDVTIVDQRK